MPQRTADTRDLVDCNVVKNGKIRVRTRFTSIKNIPRASKYFLEEVAEIFLENEGTAFAKAWRIRATFNSTKAAQIVRSARLLYDDIQAQVPQRGSCIRDLGLYQFGQLFK